MFGYATLRQFSLLSFFVNEAFHCAQHSTHPLEFYNTTTPSDLVNIPELENNQVLLRVPID
jgi:hypothetical protein